MPKFTHDPEGGFYNFTTIDHEPLCTCGCDQKIPIGTKCVYVAEKGKTHYFLNYKHYRSAVGCVDDGPDEPYCKAHPDY